MPLNERAAHEEVCPHRMIQCGMEDCDGVCLTMGPTLCWAGFTSPQASVQIAGGSEADALEDDVRATTWDNELQRLEIQHRHTFGYPDAYESQTSGDSQRARLEEVELLLRAKGEVAKLREGQQSSSAQQSRGQSGDCRLFGAELYLQLKLANAAVWNERIHVLYGPAARAAIFTVLLVNSRMGLAPKSIWTEHILPHLRRKDWPANATGGGGTRGGGVYMPQKMATWLVHSYYWCDTEAEWRVMRRHLALRLTAMCAAVKTGGRDALAEMEADWKEKVPWRPAGRSAPQFKLRRKQVHGIQVEIDEDEHANCPTAIRPLSLYIKPYGFYEDIDSLRQARECTSGGVAGTYWLGWFIQDSVLAEADRLVQKALKIRPQDAPPRWQRVRTLREAADEEYMAAALQAEYDYDDEYDDYLDPYGDDYIDDYYE
jgi:hypothetical protein